MRVFVAAPFGSKFKNGSFDRDYRSRLETVYSALEGHGIGLFSSQRNENWGDTPLAPESFVPIDYAELVQSDLVLAFLGSPPSLGVCLELGWASEMRKPLIIVSRTPELTSMVSGLSAITRALYFRSDLEDKDFNIVQLVNLVNEQLGGNTHGA